MSETSTVEVKIEIANGRATVTDFTGAHADEMTFLLNAYTPEEVRIVEDTDEAFAIEMPAEWVLFGHPPVWPFSDTEDEDFDDDYYETWGDNK